MYRANFLAFDFFFVLKEIQRRLWKAKPSSIGESMLTNKNYANLGNQVKYIDTLKCYQKCFAELATSMNEEERFTVKKVTEQFSHSHHYFKNVWVDLKREEKETVNK